MEPRKIEKLVESRREVQNSLPRQPDRKRRFQIVKLEERIAPGHGGNLGHTHGNGCKSGGHYTC